MAIFLISRIVMVPNLILISNVILKYVLQYYLIPYFLVQAINLIFFVTVKLIQIRMLKNGFHREPHLSLIVSMPFRFFLSFSQSVELLFCFQIYWSGWV